MSESLDPESIANLGRKIAKNEKINPEEEALLKEITKPNSLLECLVFKPVAVKDDKSS
jgi:hypothetical protein